MPHLAPRSLNGKFWLTFICTQLGQKVIEFAFEYSFEFNYFAVVQKYLVESLTLYAISKEFWPHCIIFKLNWLITKKKKELKFEKTFHFELENMSYVTIILPVCHAKLLFGQLHAYDVCIIALLKLCFTFEAGGKNRYGGFIFKPI